MNSLIPSMNILSSLKLHIENRDPVITISELMDLCYQFAIGGHIAILTKPYLDKILQRTKTIESRFSKVKCAPFHQVKSGDIILLKECSGPINGIAVVSEVKFIGPMPPGYAVTVMEQYQKGLALEDTFINEKQSSIYATLIYLNDVIDLKPISLIKSDRRGWIALNDQQQSRLL